VTGWLSRRDGNRGRIPDADSVDKEACRPARDRDHHRGRELPTGWSGLAGRGSADPALCGAHRTTAGKWKKSAIRSGVREEASDRKEASDGGSVQADPGQEHNHGAGLLSRIPPGMNTDRMELIRSDLPGMVTQESLMRDSPRTDHPSWLQVSTGAAPGFGAAPAPAQYEADPVCNASVRRRLCIRLC
jgi:hypothetical protein